MEVRTRLTWSQEKSLEIHFGRKLSLLYKASVHAFDRRNLLQKCCDQGPSVIVIYSDSCIIGAYLQRGFQNNKEDDFSSAFALQETKISESKIEPNFRSSMIPDYRRTLNFNFFIELKKKTLHMSSEVSKDLKLPQASPIPMQECEVFRCEDVWNERKSKGVTLLRESLLSSVRKYVPYGGLVAQVRILLLGPIGAGKSSFVNSVKSVFRGHITTQALVGSNMDGTSKVYRTYSVMDGGDGNTLSFLMCDPLGLSQTSGLCIDDIKSILKGHIPDRYKFDSKRSITAQHKDYIHHPLLEDKIHCVAFVLDANSVEMLSSESMKWIKEIRREIIKCGIPHVALLTHLDAMDLITVSDFIDIYSCEPVKLKLETVCRELGFAPSDISVVSNYVSEWELSAVKDVLIISALRQMLWAAEDFLEDQ